MTFWKRQIYEDSKKKKKKKSVFVRDKVGGGRNRWSIKDFKGSEKYSV